MIALAEPLREAKLQKSHLDLELELLEHAAELVVKEEEEGEDDSDDDSSSDDDSEGEDTEEEQADPSAVTQHEENTERLEVRPLEPGVSFEVLKEDAVTDGRDSPPLMQLQSGVPCEPGRMILELGERLGEELRIEEDVPQATQSISRRNTEGERVGERDHHQCVVGTEREERKTATSRELLDVCLQKNQLRIVTADGMDSDDEDLTVEYKGD